MCNNNIRVALTLPIATWDTIFNDVTLYNKDTNLFASRATSVAEEDAGALVPLGAISALSMEECDDTDWRKRKKKCKKHVDHERKAIYT